MEAVKPLGKNVHTKVAFDIKSFLLNQPLLDFCLSDVLNKTENNVFQQQIITYFENEVIPVQTYATV